MKIMHNGKIKKKHKKDLKKEKNMKDIGKNIIKLILKQ
jgi:hypothetical protein